MGLQVFGRREVGPTDKAKAFILSLPSSIELVLKKRRRITHLWASYKIMIKSNFLITCRLRSRAASNSSTESEESTVDNDLELVTGSQASFEYIDLAQASVQVVHDGSVLGYIFTVTPSDAKPIMFVTESEKERSRFVYQASLAARHISFNVDKLETLCTLGQGHYGRVLLSRYQTQKCTKDEELYAVKEMSIKKVNSRVLFAERSVMQMVGNHPFVLGLDFAAVRGDSVLLVSKFMAGGDLFLQLQRHGGTLPESSIQFYAAEILLAIEHLHSMNIVYRDMKPENILLTADGHLKLGDLGLAKKLPSRTGRSFSLVGTDAYLPPEMAGRFRAGHGLAVDFWQLGCLLYELKTGYPPFYASNSSQRATHHRIVYQPLQFPGDFSRELKHLIQGLLCKKQEERLGFYDGSKEVKEHPFFAGVKWDQMLSKQVPAPIMPASTTNHLVANFDEQFTSMPHKLHFVAPSVDADRDFAGFDYVCPSMTTDNLSVSLSETVVTDASVISDEQPLEMTQVELLV